jgi:PAS domain S-box-containing protein
MVEHLPAPAAYVEHEAVWINPPAESLTGYTGAELSTLANWFSLLHGAEAERVRQDYAADQAAGFKAPRTVPVRCKSGQVRWIEFARHRQEAGEIWLMHDLTQRMRAEYVREVLLSLQLELSATTTPDQASRIVFAAASKLWDWDCGWIDLYSAAEDCARTLLCYDIVDGQRREVPSVSRPGPPTPRLRRVLQHGGHLELRQPPFELSGNVIMFGNTNCVSASILCVPIRSQGRTVGGFSIQSYTPNAFSTEDLQTLQGLADQCGGALERIQANQAMRESEDRYRHLFEDATEGIALADVDTGLIVDCNQAFLKLFGYEKGQVVGQSQRMLHPPQAGGAAVTREFAEHAGGKSGTVLPVPIVTSKGLVRLAEVKANLLELGGRRLIQGFFRDVTDEQRYHHERETTLKLLRLLNDFNHTHELLANLTGFLQTWTGCEAVGVRLREGNDFPYYETRGFPKEFLTAENSLCARVATGEILVQPSGAPQWECLCGYVLAGCLGSSLECFTPHGSFWTNSISELLAAGSREGLPKTYRGRCLATGYESMALIPLRHGDQTFGLVQFSDHAKGRFSPELISFLENSADQIAIALAQRRASAALRESEQRFREIIESTHAGYFRLNRQGEFVAVNGAWLRMHGYTCSEEVLGKNFSCVQVETDLSGALNIMERLLGGAPVLEGEFTRRCKNGEIGYHSFSARPVRENNAIVGLEGFLIDTTSLKRAQANYAMLFDKMLEGFALHEMIFDEAGRPVDYRFLAVNPGFESMTGLPAKTILGRRVLEVMPSLEPFWIETFGRVAVTGEPEFFERFNKELARHFAVSAFRPAPGQFAVIMVDITSRKQLEQRLLQSQKMEAIGHLAGGVAHDFNNILASIMLHLGLLEQHPTLDHETRRSLQDIGKESQRAANLTRQLLMFSRRSVMQTRVLDLSDLVTNLLKMLRRLIGEHISLRFDSKEGLPAIVADPGMIEQVLLNLCVNARDAMPPTGGTVTIRLETVTLDDLAAQSQSGGRPGRFVCLSVADTGCGMDERVLPHIFEPFFTTKEAGKGTGLGLATVHGIVGQHQGWVQVESRVGQGSTFRVFLPAVAQSAQPSMTPEKSPLRTGHETILLAEDEPMLRRVTARGLRRLGYRVLEAANGREALHTLEQSGEEVALLLSDMVMPEGLSGIDLARTLRDRQPGLKVIICTGYSAEMLTQGIPAEKDIVLLQKPYQFEALSAAIRQCLDAPPPP